MMSDELPPEKRRSREELIAAIETRELSPEEKFAAEDPETMVPRALAQGRSREEIIAELVRLDWSRPAAERLIDRIANDLKRYQESPESRRAVVAEAKKDLATGASLGIVGVLLTALCLGVGYVVALGVVFMIGGLFLMHRGWTRLRAFRQANLPAPPERPPMP